MPLLHSGGQVYADGGKSQRGSDNILYSIRLRVVHEEEDEEKGSTEGRCNSIPNSQDTSELEMIERVD